MVDEHFVTYSDEDAVVTSDDESEILSLPLSADLNSIIRPMEPTAQTNHPILSYSTENGDCAAFLANYDTKSAARVMFNNMHYKLPPWSISILSDCRNAVFNTANVGVQASQMPMLLSTADMISWGTYNEDLTSLDDSSMFTTFGPLEQINVTRDASDYLWYTTNVDIDSSEFFLHGGHTEHLTSDEVAMLVTSLKALSGAVSYINPDHHQLLLSSMSGISGMSLWNYGPSVLVEMIVSLAAVIGKCLYLCLDMLVNNFMPSLSFLKLLQQPRGLAKKEQVLSRVHSALKEIADLVPHAPLRLEQVIQERMPHRHTRHSWILSVIYVENMLRVDSGVMGNLLGRSMLIEVMNKIVELDLEIGWDELSNDDSSKDMFEMELEKQETSAAAVMGSTEISKDSSNQKILLKNEVIEHLDLLMVFIYEHLKFCYESGRLAKVFEVLLLSFRSTVLNAYKSKFSQFVMFYACSLDPEACGKRFAHMLFQRFEDSTNVSAWRIRAVEYLGSYLACAKFVSDSDVAATVAGLINPSLNIKSLRTRVGPETGNVLDNTFWENPSVGVNNRDTVNARLYVDQKCLYLQKPKQSDLLSSYHKGVTYTILEPIGTGGPEYGTNAYEVVTTSGASCYEQNYAVEKSTWKWSAVAEPVMKLYKETIKF